MASAMIRYTQREINALHRTIANAPDPALRTLSLLLLASFQAFLYCLAQDALHRNQLTGKLLPSPQPERPPSSTQAKQRRRLLPSARHRAAGKPTSDAPSARKPTLQSTHIPPANTPSSAFAYKPSPTPCPIVPPSPPALARPSALAGVSEKIPFPYAIRALLPG
ncbi:hypothetical protein BU23DRAFT_551111 [Bimuria novae-zelandiae CBS 107.79]|uniref:Uncharacterized protein n=1 Tax=Bimuria novae-zelandiae CBS 107.79 TaxID=1447943 RepID=A0A6A5VQL3_9PLEO|nr:hypothetical protein BU23DRAFT_551111 [Bimuria novae-zelandiae CBS 107.79]